jgi:hypothetical protein
MMMVVALSHHVSPRLSLSNGRLLLIGPKFATDVRVVLEAREQVEHEIAEWLIEKEIKHLNMKCHDLNLPHAKPPNVARAAAK